MTTVADEQGVEIRRARDEELESVVRLRWVWTVFERGEPAEMLEDEFVRDAAAWARAHAETHLPHVAADASGCIVGMAWLALTPRVATTRSRDRWSGDLQSCYVLPELRGRGIGGALVRAVLGTARSLGAEHVTVHTSPASIAMYRRNGFAEDPRLLYADSAITGR